MKARFRWGAVVTCSLLLTLSVPGSCRGQTGPVKVEVLSWLGGCWVVEGPSASAMEVWMAPDGGLMVGMARSVRGEQATGFEFLVLRDTDTGVVFSANPWNQAPQDFPATVVTDSLLRVENPEHDSPQKLEYVRVTADSVTAKVYGEVRASEPAFQLTYARCQGLPWED